MAKVLLKNSFTSASVPAGLSAGELAVNVTDRKLFVGNAVGGVVTLIDPNALVTSVNGATGAVTNINAATVTTTSSNSSSTFYPLFAGGAGNTALYVDDVTTPFTYVPSSGTLNIRNLNALNGNTGTFLTTSNLGVVNSLDSTELSISALNHVPSSSNSFTVSSTNSLKLSGSTVQFYGSGWGYTFPTSNGSANQVLTTNGATPATLTWSTPSSGITTGTANTFTALQTFSAGITSTTLYASAGVTFNSTSAHTGLGTFSAGITSTTLYASAGVTFNSTSAHTGLGTFSAGITSTTLYASAGVTFNSTSAHTGLGTFSAGIIATDTTDGIGVISTKGALDTSPARNGAIRLGYVNSTPSYNILLNNASGLFTIYNGFSSTGSNLLNINSTVMNVNVPVSGMTFTGNISAPNIVTGISGATGPIGLVAGTNITIAQSGKTFTFSSSSSGGTQVGVTSSGQLFDVKSWAFSYCDFHGGPGPFGTVLGASGGDVVYYVDSPGSHIFTNYQKYTGVASLRTGASGSYVALGCVTPSASYSTAVGPFSMGLTFEFRTRISTDYGNDSTATNNFTIYAGVDEQSALYPTFNTSNGAACWFEYNHASNSGNWTANLCEYFGRTASVGTTFAYTNADNKFDIIRGMSGGTGHFFMYINGVTVAGFSFDQGLLGQGQGNARIVVRRTASAASVTRRTFVDYLSILQQRGT